MEFEWDPRKADANLRKHGVGFEEALEGFYDVGAVDDFDEEHSSDEEHRFTLIGISSMKLLLVIYTVRTNDRIRIISARKATRRESGIYEKANKKG